MGTGRFIIYFIKMNLRDFGIWFWMLVFPLTLTFLFVLTTENTQNNLMNNIPVGIAHDSEFEDQLHSIESLEVTQMTTSEGEEALESERIYAFIDNDNTLYVTSSGVYQSIIEEILNELHQMNHSELNFDTMDFNTSFIEEESYDSEPQIIMFFSLLAMYCFYSMFSSMDIAIYAQAYLSPHGSRFSSSPYNHIQFMLANVFVSVLISMATVSIIIIFLMVVYQNVLFDALFHTLTILFLGSMAGVGIGFIIGTLPLQTNIKMMITLITTLLLGQSAGLGGEGLRNVIHEYLPWLNDYNPMALITDTLYKINYMGHFETYIETVLILVLFMIVTLTITLFLLRRQQYDHI